MTEELKAEVFQCLSQPALDEIVFLLDNGDREQARAVLIEEEGHWLSQEDAERFIDLLIEEKGRKS